MTNEHSKPVPRSGYEFDRREKAYHVYLFTLQKRNYGSSLREYARSHNLKRDTLRSWVERYPGGKPFYDADNELCLSKPPAKSEKLMVKLSQEQLKPKVNNEITDIRRELFTSSNAIMIKFYDSVISADSSNIALVLSAIKNISNGQGR